MGKVKSPVECQYAPAQAAIVRCEGSSERPVRSRHDNPAVILCGQGATRLISGGAPRHRRTEAPRCRSQIVLVR